MPEAPEDLFSPIRKGPSKPYRGLSCVRVKDLHQLTHAEQMALDAILDERQGLLHRSLTSPGAERPYLVSYRPGQTGTR